MNKNSTYQEDKKNIQAPQDFAHQGVLVESSGRLHMGFFDLNAGLGRKFGSIGVSLSEPSIEVFVYKSPVMQVKKHEAVNDELLDKTYRLLSLFQKALHVTDHITVDIRRFVTAHAGLGSGTQLALCLGAAINQLYGLHLSTMQIASIAGRGGRSGIGIAAFDQGGLLVDGGRSTSRSSEHQVPPLLARYAFPEAWRILLIFDDQKPGVHGSDEKAAFNTLPTFPEDLAAHLCRHVLMQAMPAMVEQDLSAFGQSIQALQAHTGDYFAPAQGGRYASPVVGRVLDFVAKAGFACYGQSSWGPTGFVVFESQAIAENFLTTLQLEFADERLRWLLTSGKNSGAKITINAGAI